MVLNQSKGGFVIIPFNRRCLAGLFFILSNFLAFVNISDAEWSIQVVDAPKSFYGAGFCEPSSRAIAINASNHPHIVYGGGSGLYYTYYDGSSWQEERVDTSSGEVDSFASIALDSKGKAHISYYDVTNYDLKYATNASGAWVITTVDSSGSVGGYTSIALDSKGKAHISYFDITNGDLKYATNASGTWVTTTVDSSGSVGMYTSIALDSSGKAHISYEDITNDDLKYATNASGPWVTTTVDSGSVGEYTSIALDSSGKAHISYWDPSTYNYDLKYATNASGAWETTTVDSDWHIGGEYTSIAIDNSGKVHISSYNYDSEHSYSDQSVLYYTTNASGEWVTTVVDRSNEDVGEYTSIALDSKGKAHISYSSGGLKYVTNTSGTWVITTVDDSGTGETSIMLDSSGKAHISYSSGGLKYVTNTSGTWVITTVDSSSNSDSDELGTSNSIALDSSGKVHISYSAYYYDDDSGHVNTRYYLKYATNASGAWVITTVDSGSNSRDNLGSHNSIALDSAGKAHISYYEADYGDDDDNFVHLKYATNSSGTWTTTTVDSSGDVGRDTSIALDSSNKAHISYLDSDNYDLKYATNASGTWVTTTVDSSWGFTSIALDSYGKVHISYYTRDLKYATNASGTWVMTVVDSVDDVGGYTSIAMDKSDKAHISYYDWTNNALKYAANADISSTPTPTPTPTATPTVTPTTTPTATPAPCEEATDIIADPSELTLQTKASDMITVTVTGEDGCPVEGDSVRAKVEGSGNEYLKVSPKKRVTNASGKAVFTVKGKGKAGNAKVTFKDGDLSTQVNVTVVK